MRRRSRWRSRVECARHALQQNEPARGVGDSLQPRNDAGVRPLVFVVILLGCGRFGFDPLDRDRAPSDAPPSDAPPNDAQPVSLELLAGDLGGPGNLDGTGAGARFNFPSTVAVDSVGNLYVGDTDNAVIRKVTAVGVVTTLAGAAGLTGSADGTGAAARFNLPHWRGDRQRRQSLRRRRGQ
jgi:hypothetical protein